MRQSMEKGNRFGDSPFFFGTALCRLCYNASFDL